MTTLHLDTEVFSEEDLEESGVYRYAEHASTELLCFGYAFDDGEVQQWKPGEPLPPDVVSHISSHGEIRAHNAAFERVVLNGTAGKKIGFPPIAIEQTVCTAAKAAASGIPRSLADGAKALSTYPKSEYGRIELLQICRPRRPSKADPSPRWTLANAPEKYAAMYAYNLDDVRAERDLDNALPDLTEQEQKLYWLDQRINSRGWKVDLKAVNDILYVVEEYKKELAAECRQLTEDWKGDGLEPTQREKIAEWVREQGFKTLPGMQAETIIWAVKQDIPANVKRVLRIYSAYNAKSVSKLQAMLNAVCADGRLRGMFMFYGAATGRWSSLIVQLQNTLRPLIKDPNTAIEAFAERSLELIRFLYPDLDPMKVAGSCIRGCLVADDGADLVFPDFSGVEDRVNAWFFEEEWVLQAYKDYDAGKGRHLYSKTVCRWFGFDLDTFSDEDPRRQWGKVGRLALNYEGGVGAFATMVDTYGVDLQEMTNAVLPLLPGEALEHAKWMHEHHPASGELTEDQETACNGLKFLFRRDHPRIKQGWRDLKEAAEKAVEFEGEAFWLPNRKIAFKVETYRGRKWLCMRLPSGRKIKYFDPKWTPSRESERWINNELVPYTVPGYMEYVGIDTYTRQWVRQQTYGGKLDENADQGFSRDLLCNAMLSLDAAGYTIIASEHDKAILEVPKDFGSVEEIKRLMITQPEYAAGLPLATDGKRVRRYGK